MRVLAHVFIVLFLTLISQLGGLAWVLSLGFKRRMVAFASSYFALSVAALWVAPLFGRVPLPCLTGDALGMQSTVFCALNRQYVSPVLKDVLSDYAANMKHAYPGTETRVLDANFPFISGFPLLPHLSHDDGDKVDLAFYYQDQSGYLPGAARSPVGYFAFEEGPSDCPDVTGPTLRWDLAWLQPMWPDYALEALRMQKGLDLLGADDRVGKIFIEPHLKRRFDAGNDKIRFQGCRAARHDDHIHLQL